ncbi:hypothetical protein D3C72_2554930 [compost metagenome]
MKAAANERVSNTVGGKLTKAIESGQNQSEPASQRPVFEDDYIAAGNEEVADFVNPKPPQE